MSGYWYSSCGKCDLRGPPCEACVIESLLRDFNWMCGDVTRKLVPGSDGIWKPLDFEP